MKKLFVLILMPWAINASLTLEQFTPFTKEVFKARFKLVQSRLKMEGIDTQCGMAKIYTELLNISIEDVFNNPEALRIAQELYETIKKDSHYQEIVDRLAKVKTENSFEDVSYDYLKFIYIKAIEIGSHHCLGLKAPEEKRDRPNDREWMMIDNPEFFRLNQKEFNDGCKNCVMGVNAVTSLAAQELVELVKK